MSENYYETPQMSEGNFEDIKNLMKPMHWLAFEVIVSQGIVNAIILAISWRLYFITTIISLVSIVFAVLAIIGIINAANGRAKELPVIGKIKLLK